MSSNRSIARREVFVPTPFAIWEDELRAPQPPQLQLQPQPEGRHVFSLFIPPLIRPSTPVSGRSSPAPLAIDGTDGADPIKRDPLIEGNEKEVEVEDPKKGGKRGIVRLLGRVKSAFHKLLKGMKHE